MPDEDRFSFQIGTVDEAAEPFRAALKQTLADEGVIRLLIYTPPDVYREKHGALVLAVTTDGWFCFEKSKRGAVAVSRCDFARTILVQMTSVLLSGTLRIDFAEGFTARSVVMEYNTVTEHLYWGALQMLLHGINGVPAGPAIDRGADRALLESLPLKFINATWTETPPDEHVRAIAHWPAAIVKYNRWFQRELAPEAVFALSERELILISEEKARWSWSIGGESKYGDVATYLPLSRLRDFRFGNADGATGELEVIVGAAEASETIAVEFPAEHLSSIREVVERAFREKPSAPTSVAE
jgi:hypothetical protein